MLGWLRKKSRPLRPESKWIVAIDGDRISVQDDVGEVKCIRKDRLTGIAIETNDSGPWGADVWWLLFGEDNQIACRFPQGATGEDPVVEFIVTLPSFDLDEMIKAMACTDNAVFSVWRRARE